MTDTDHPMFRCNIDDSDVLVVTIDDPDQSANTMNARFLREFPALVDHLTDERERIAGVVITSAKRTFCAGGDLDKLMHATAADAQSAYDATIEFHTATRQLGTLGSSKISTNLIKSRFFDLQSINRGANRPEGHPEYSATKLVVLGAGMMGAAIIYVSAKAGIDVVLKDITRERADKGKDYSAKLLAKAVEGGRMTAAERNAVLARILPTDDPADAAGADVAIEAVFEDPDLKKRVIDEVIPYLASDALIASNTSTLPITELADVARQIGKTSIVVNDSRGFFTSRVIATFLDEAVAMIGEGVPAASIERAANQAGYPVGPLGVVDEVSLTLSRATRQETISARRAAGIVVAPHRAGAVIDKMIDQYERSGRAAGAGSYEYADNRRLGLWPELAEAFGPVIPSASPVELQERMLFANAIDGLRCLDEGVLRSEAEGNVGSLLGIGFPAWTGGVSHYVEQYDGGAAGFVARARQLADRYGERFMPPTSLIELTEAEAAA